jgi:hypothetical protein
MRPTKRKNTCYERRWEFSDDESDDESLDGDENGDEIRPDQEPKRTKAEPARASASPQTSQSLDGDENGDEIRPDQEPKRTKAEPVRASASPSPQTSQRVLSDEQYLLEQAFYEAGPVILQQLLRLEGGQAMKILTASMTAESWMGEHFELIGDRSVHYGLFDCGGGEAVGAGEGGVAGGACC